MRGAEAMVGNQERREEELERGIETEKDGRKMSMRGPVLDQVRRDVGVEGDGAPRREDGRIDGTGSTAFVYKVGVITSDAVWHWCGIGISYRH